MSPGYEIRQKLAMIPIESIKSKNHADSQLRLKSYSTVVGTSNFQNGGAVFKIHRMSIK